MSHRGRQDARSIVTAVSLTGMISCSFGRGSPPDSSWDMSRGEAGTQVTPWRMIGHRWEQNLAWDLVCCWRRCGVQEAARELRSANTASQMQMCHIRAVRPVNVVLIH